MPWQDRATRVDLALLGAIVGVVAFGLAVRPVKPFLLASHPVTLAVLTGDLVPIGAAAAFARTGETPLWLVVLAGAIGMVKFDWLTWWTGRQWGEGIIQMFTTRLVHPAPERLVAHHDKPARQAVTVAVR